MGKLWALFKTFFLLGLLTFGGGIAMLPYIKRQAIRQGWIADQEWDEIVTLSQVIPGAIAVNCAHLIGYRARRHLGGLTAIFGMILPPIILISLLAIGLDRWLTIPLVIQALNGMFLVVIVLFSKAVFSLGTAAWKKWWVVPMSLITFALTYWQVLSPIWVMAIAVGLSLLLTTLPGVKR